MYRIDNWINEGFGWIIESINSEFNISKYAPLFRNSFIKLPNELKHPKKSLINIKNSDNRCFLWCHVRHLNLIDNNPQRINKEDRKIADILNYSDIGFRISKKYYCRIEKQNNICINVFCYDSRIIYLINISSEKFRDSMDFLLTFEENKSHYVFVKDCGRLMFNKTKNRNKKIFCRYCLQCFSSESILTEHKEICLTIN